MKYNILNNPLSAEGKERVAHEVSRGELNPLQFFSSNTSTIKMIFCYPLRIFKLTLWKNYLFIYYLLR